MIGLFAKIPFHAQLRIAEPRLASEVAEAVNGIVSAFAASRQPTDESFLLSFDESSRPCRLRAAEAARCLSQKLGSLGPRLYGWAILLDAGAGTPDEALRVARQMWFGIQGDGLYVSSRSKAYFNDYFLFGPVGAGREETDRDQDSRACIPVLDAIYARATLPVSDNLDQPQAAAVDKLIDALGALGVGQEGEAALAVLGPGKGPILCLDAALAKLYGEAAPRFLRLRASAVESSPYGPIAGAFASLVSPKRGVSGPGALLSGAERGLLEELRPMLDFLLRSPYRKACSPQIDIRLRLCTAAALRFYAREARAAGLPAFVILEGIERFPDPSLALIIGLVAETLAAEGIAILAAGSELPKSWRSLPPRSLEISGPSPTSIAQASLRAAEALCSPGSSSALALAAAGDPLRLRLALRLLASGRSVSPAASTESLAAEALATFPREYAELLLSLKLTEEVLTDDCVEEYLRDSGYVDGVRSPIYEALACLGYVSSDSTARDVPSRDTRPRIASAAAANRIGEALPDGGKAVNADFTRRVLRLRAEGRILPSYALFRRLGDDASLEAPGAKTGLALDSISADAVYGASDPPGLGPVGSPLDPMTDFLAAYGAAEREACLAAMRKLESASASLPEDRLFVAAAALARAGFDYADGDAQSAAASAKNALIALHALGASKAEAKAHRMLGLCALALEQAPEGADYLANAFDLAQAIPEPLECILAAVSEAAAAFVLGDLGKAAGRADATAAWAAAGFRADWESAAAFVKGRAALEIGRYDEAEGCFGRVRAISRVYGQPEAARRAEVWTGRAAAFAGESARARELLGRSGDDAEALWFLSELELWDGAPDKAVALASASLARVPPRRFSPADAFDWSSGFASLEGRAVGYAGARSYLRDQVEAFGEFAAGMAAPAVEGPVRAERLAAMAREDRLAALHPAAHLYLFYRYLILERASPSSMDGASALSKAFKALQLRSTRMGEASLKDGFLESNRWNRALIEAARARKLI